MKIHVYYNSYVLSKNKYENLKKKKEFKVSRSVTSEEGRFFKNFNKKIITQKSFFLVS
jgi:hypothetical protein